MQDGEHLVDVCEYVLNNPVRAGLVARVADWPWSYSRYGVDVWRRFGADLERFVDAGWLRRRGSRLHLTRQGMLLAHEVMSVFV